MLPKFPKHDVTPVVRDHPTRRTAADTTHTKALRLAGYSAAAVSSMAAASAQAEELYLEFGFDIGQGVKQDLDLNLDEQFDLELKNYIFFNGNYQGATVPFAPGQLVGFQTGQFYASLLQSGDAINASTVGPSFVGSMAYGTTNPDAQWNDVTDGYLGLTFPAGETTFYGWVRLDIDNTNGTMFLHDSFISDDPNGIVAGQLPSLGILGDYNSSGQVEQGDLDLVLQNWGLDTDTNPIPAGWTNDLPAGQIEQTELDGVLQNWGSTLSPDFTGSAVPEPGSLAFLAAGAAGLSAMRRRARRTTDLA